MREWYVEQVAQTVGRSTRGDHETAEIRALQPHRAVRDDRRVSVDHLGPAVLPQHANTLGRIAGKQRERSELTPETKESTLGDLVLRIGQAFQHEADPVGVEVTDLADEAHRGAHLRVELGGPLGRLVQEGSEYRVSVGIGTAGQRFAVLEENALSDPPRRVRRYAERPVVRADHPHLGDEGTA